jgi:hypothetical protein
MIPIQNPKAVVALAGTVSTVTTGYTYGPRIDTKGADAATFIVASYSSTAGGTNGYNAFVLEESDVTTTANFAALSGFTYTATQVTAVTATDNATVAAAGPVAFFSTSLVGKKRFIRIGARAHSSATALVSPIVCLLGNNSPAASNSNGAQVSVIA